MGNIQFGVVVTLCDLFAFVIHKNKKTLMFLKIVLSSFTIDNISIQMIN